MAVDMDFTSNTALSSDIDALRARFPQTQELYREVCALLFFRYGVTPTANKLYQLVRKGSMSAPADALTKFWEDLRKKSRTKIEHPDLPEALKTAAGELMATLWSKAQVAAQESLAAYKAESQVQVVQAKDAMVAAQADRDMARGILESTRIELKQAMNQIAALREQLAATEAARMAIANALEEARDDNAALGQQLKERHSEFTAEVDKLHAATQLAEERFRSTEKRALLEIDRERTVAASLRKDLQGLRVEATQSDERHRKEVAQLQDQLGDIKQQKGQLEGKLQTMAVSLDLASAEAKQMQAQFGEANAQAALYCAQAQDWRSNAEQMQQRLTDMQIANRPMRGRRKPG